MSELDDFKDIAEDIPSYDQVVQKHKANQVSILIHRSSARFIYMRLTKNPLVRVFHTFATLYSFPVTIIAGIVLPILFGRYLYILFYFCLLGILIGIEDSLLRRITTKAALEDRATFRELYQKGIIVVKETK